jgi:phage terminase large subunit GpA-like protein
VTVAARIAAGSLILFFVIASRPVAAYSVLAHESNIDAVWESHLRPPLHQKFPSATSHDLLAARAYAYGGSLIQDMERLFLESLDSTRRRFRETLTALRSGPVHFANVNLDTGKLAVPAEYERADEAEAALRKRQDRAAAAASREDPFPQ